MKDYDYIIQQCKVAHFSRWNDVELRKCVELLPNLSRQELTALYYSKWVKEDRVLRESVFNTLFKYKVGKREERVKNLPIEELIAEFHDKKSGNVALVRKEMRERYKAGKDRGQIVIAFNNATKSDLQWVKWQIRKERYGNSGSNNRW